jgi:xanthine dehydrogenase YagS FAD-binding subunit
MRPFAYSAAADAPAAVRAASASAPAAPVHFLAGGTTMIDLMKLDVLRPAQLIDITRIAEPRLRSIEVGADGLRIGALATMRQVADHRTVLRDCPVLSQSLWLAASQQIRNMACVGGNVLQRTRCSYFRDTSWPCNKREPGSGCSALQGMNRWHAVLGTSQQCIASYPGDWATALVALDAKVETLTLRGPRTFRFADLHRLPGNTPHIDTQLEPGELITGFVVPNAAYNRRSLYLKLRDRESYEFALASAAVALDMDGATVRQVRIGIGGPVAVPWRAVEAETFLTGKPLTEANAQAAARTVFTNAKTYEHNAFRIPLAQQTLVRALLQAQAMELPS